MKYTALPSNAHCTAPCRLSSTPPISRRLVPSAFITHVWVMNADGTNRREIGGVLDNRQGAVQWALDGSAVYFILQERGDYHLVRLPINGGQPEYVVRDPGFVGAFSVGKNGAVAYSFTGTSDAGQLYYKSGSTPPRK